MNKTIDHNTSSSPPGKAYTLVIEHIKELFRKGDIHFGEKLPSERALMTALGLGRNSVREALRSLENMGIIESRHGQGNFLVNNMDKSLGGMLSLLHFVNECSYEEISQFRKSLEIGACLFILNHDQETGLHSLGTILSRLKTGSLEERIYLDKDFHDTLISLSGNRLMILINEALSELFADNIREILLRISPAEWDLLLACHTRIYEALSERMEADCIAAVMEHYDFIEGYQMPSLSSKNSSNSKKDAL